MGNLYKHNKQEGTGFPANRLFRLITDENNDQIIEDNGAQKILGLRESLNTTSRFYQCIFDKEGDKVSYLRERVKIFHNEFINLIKSKLLVNPYYSKVFLLTDFPMKKRNGDDVKIYDETSVWKSSVTNASFKILHSCTYLRNRNKSYSPNAIQIYNEEGERLTEIESMLCRRAAPMLILKQPLTPTELDICEYYLNGFIESKEIASKRGGSAQTVDKHRTAIGRKGGEIAPGLNNFINMSFFLRTDGII